MATPIDAAHRCDWLAVDWGTTQLRIWAMSADGAMMAPRSAPCGMATTPQGSFEETFRSVAADQLEGRAEPVIVVCCGMAGARQGWTEAPYRATPSRPISSADAVRVATQDPRLMVWILPGLRQLSPPDVMRGEETQIAGLLAQDPTFDGVACLPGTHTKWAHVSAGEIVSFQTFMTGELFATLSANSILQHSVAYEGWDEAAFQEAVDTILSRPERLAAELFRLRAADLLTGASPVVARARLSGLLIGAEIAAAKPYWLGRRVAVVGGDASTRPYLSALAQQGVQAAAFDGDALTLSGLTAAYQELESATA